MRGEYTKHDASRTEGSSDWNIFASSWWNMDGNGTARRWVGNNKDYNDHAVINTDGAPTERYGKLVGATPVAVAQVSHKDFGDDDGDDHSHPAITVAGPATAWEMLNHGIYVCSFAWATSKRS